MPPRLLNRLRLTALLCAPLCMHAQDNAAKLPGGEKATRILHGAPVTLILIGDSTTDVKGLPTGSAPTASSGSSLVPSKGGA